MAQIEKLKAQMKKMQEENERIGNENDQLKGFRKDGSQLTKQLRLINKEKDKMLVLVDNKDDEIELLL
jgi:regulator of replication initiation timing